MSFSQGQMPSRDPYDPQMKQGFQLTPEEIKILQECSREGIWARALPMGITFGLAGFLGSKAGILVHKKWGAKPAVVTLGLLGYFVGRFSYSKVCVQRCMEQVPHGTIRNMYEKQQKTGEYVEPPTSYYYANVEPSKAQDRQDPTWPNQKNTDISDVPTMSAIDTVPSEYYIKSDEEYKPNAPVENYTSYDDLRRQNRQEYTNRLYPNSQQTYSSQPQDGPAVRRRPTAQSTPDTPVGPKTKYGDAWEV